VPILSARKLSNAIGACPICQPPIILSFSADANFSSSFAMSTSNVWRDLASSQAPSMDSPNRATHSQDLLPAYQSGDVAARAASAPILAVRQFESQPLLTAGDEQGEWHSMAVPTTRSWTSNPASSKKADVTREFRAPANSWLADSHEIRERAYEENARRRKSRVWFGVGAVTLVSIVLAVFLPVFFLVIRKNSQKNRFVRSNLYLPHGRC
jgi:glucan 1,3-beta-glucosidase